jgi:hypothetical protein
MGFCPPFPPTLTTPAIGPKQLGAIWNQVLQPDPEGPTLISHAAWLNQMFIVSSSLAFVAHPGPGMSPKVG